MEKKIYIKRETESEWEGREKKREERNLWFFGGTERRVKNEKKTISECGARGARGRVGGGGGDGAAKGPQYFKLPSPPSPAQRPDAQWSFVIFSRMSTQTPRLRTPFRLPYTEFTLCSLGMKIRVVATRLFGVTFILIWETESSVGYNYHSILWKGNAAITNSPQLPTIICTVSDRTDFPKKKKMKLTMFKISTEKNMIKPENS